MHRNLLLCRAVRAAVQPGKTTLVMLESPTNPRMGICDIKALCKIARQVLHHCCPCTLLPCMCACRLSEFAMGMQCWTFLQRTCAGLRVACPHARHYPTSPWSTHMSCSMVPARSRLQGSISGLFSKQSGWEPACSSCQAAWAQTPPQPCLWTQCRHLAQLHRG